MQKTEMGFLREILRGFLRGSNNCVFSPFGDAWPEFVVCSCNAEDGERRESGSQKGQGKQRPSELRPSLTAYSGRQTIFLPFMHPPCAAVIRRSPAGGDASGHLQRTFLRAPPVVGFTSTPTEYKAHPCNARNRIRRRCRKLAAGTPFCLSNL